MDFGCFKPFMDNNNNNNSHLDYFHDNNYNIDQQQTLGNSVYGISSSQLDTCYQISGYSFYNNAHTMMVHKMEDEEAYNMANIMPNITPKFSFPISSSSSTAMEDRFLGFRQNNGHSNMVIKAVRKNMKRSKKKTNMVKGQWTLEEDRRLIKLVEKYGIRKWSHIAQMLPGRIGKQCRERWHNHLRPNIKKDSWTEDEDRVLIEAHKEVGNKWAEIAKRLPGRTENSLKNHWNTTKRRQFARRRRTRSPKNSTGGATTVLQDYIKSLAIVNGINGGNVPGNSAKTERIDQAEVEVENDMIIPSYDLFADMYSLLFDEKDNELLLPDITGSNIVFDNMDEVIMDIKWDDEVFVGTDGDGDGDGMVVMPGSNEIVVKKEMDLLEMISQSSGGSNCVSFN